MSDLSKMEVAACPHCSAKYVWHPASEAWVHEINRDGCHMNLSMLYNAGRVESHNRRAPPAELVEAYKEWDGVEHFGTAEDFIAISKLVMVVSRICEVGK